MLLLINAASLVDAEGAWSCSALTVAESVNSIMSFLLPAKSNQTM